MGKTSEEIFTALLPDIEEQKRIAITEECGKQEEVEISKNGGKLFDNLEKTLQILSQKYDLYIVSNCQAGYIEAFFDYHKLGHYFKDYENSGRTGKPKGENIKLIIQRNNIKKHFILVTHKEITMQLKLQTFLFICKIWLWYNRYRSAIY